MNQQCNCCEKDLGPPPAIRLGSYNTYCGKCAFYQGVCCPLPEGTREMMVSIVGGEDDLIRFAELEVDLLDHPIEPGLNVMVRDRPGPWRHCRILSIRGKYLSVQLLEPRR